MEELAKAATENEHYGEGGDDDAETQGADAHSPNCVPAHVSA